MPRSAGWAVVGCLVSCSGLAASLHVSPVSLRMQPAQMATVIVLDNQGDQSLVAQVRLFAWDQTLREDVLQPQNALQVSPPMARLQPHAVQVVRVIRNSQAVTSKEMTFRLLIDELPDPAVRSEHSVDIRLRYSVPLFVLPPGPAHGPILTWQLDRREGRSYLRVANRGDQHAQISAVEIDSDPRGSLPLAAGLLGYALAGREREWLLPDQPDVRNGAPLRLKAVVNQQTVVAPLLSSEAQVK